MTVAVATIRNVQITFLASDYVDNGVHHHVAGLQQVEQQWYQNHSWRKEGIWGSRLVIGYATPHQGRGVGTFYRYDSKLHRVVAMEETGAQISDFSLPGLIGEDFYKSALSNPAILGHSIDDGMMITELALTGTGTLSGERDICWIDDSTSLPIRIDYQAKRGTNLWTTRMRNILVFNQNLSPSLFDPSTLKHEAWRQPWDR
jgi:hypothetical protein